MLLPVKTKKTRIDKMRMQAVLLLTALFLFSCSSLRYGVGIVADEQGAMVRQGSVAVNGITVPGVFEFIQYQGAAFRFVSRTRSLNMEGYYPDRPVELKVSGKSPTATDLEKGWYRGPDFLHGTPSGWMYVKWKTGDAYVRPDRLEAMIKELKLEPLPRRLEDQMTI